MRCRRRPFFRPDAENAVVAAGHRDPLERDRPDDLRECQRQHREIHAGQLHREKSEHRRAETPEQRAEQQRDDHRQAGEFGEKRDAVGAEPEIRCVAERGEPADRHQEMQARGEDHEDRNLRADRQRVIAADQRQRRRQHQRDDRGQAFIRGQRTPGVDRQSRRAARGRLRLSEQPPGTHDQHHGHHQEYQDDGYLRKNQDAEGVQFRNQHRRDKGADDAAETADHHHHEHVDDDAQIHGVMHRVARNLQRAAERREKYADREHAGKQPFLIDTERRHHVAILRRGADQNAPARALEQQPQQSEHDRTEHNQEQVIGRNILAEKINRALESRRAATQEIARPPDQDDEILDHQGQAERRQQLKQLRRVIDSPQQHHLDQHADHGHDQRRGNDPAPKADRAGKSLGQRERHIGAEHVEGAMREIDDPRHAEDDRQARRHQKQRRGAGKTGQELDEVKGHQSVLI